MLFSHLSRRSVALAFAEALLFCAAIYSVLRTFGAWAFIDSIDIGYYRIVNFLLPTPSSPNIATAWIIAALVFILSAAACGYFSRMRVDGQIAIFASVFMVIALAPPSLLMMLRVIEDALPNVRFN
jgi:hypothetical protein